MTLNDISWSFNNTYYNCVEDFSKDVSKHQIMVNENDEAWVPSEIIIESPILQIQYMAWVKPEDILENESLIEEDAEAFKDEPDDDNGMYQVEILAKFKADNGKNFTADEFLMKAHNAQVNKDLGDHIFFEGLDNEPSIIDGIPSYYIACGS